MKFPAATLPLGGICLWLMFLAPAGAQSPQDLTSLLEANPDLRDPAQRSRVTAGMKGIEEARKQRARTEAARQGLPERRSGPGGRYSELVDWLDGKPLYLSTNNGNAAISTGVDLLRPAPYSLSGSGVIIGLWDGGAARSSHTEFGGRVTVKDASSVIDHATHVAGTLGASGVVPSAKGMAPAATVDSYDWNSDSSEMISRGAVVAGDPGKIQLSNHSYNYIGGWNYVGGSVTWEWHGSGTSSTSVEDDFGRYNTYARDADSMAYNAPYYLVFRSAGNERTDNPSTGQSVALAPGGTAVTYDAATHPGGDGSYRGGYDTIGFNALGKNVITVGSASDAVAGGLRSPAQAEVSYFSSWGPTDDGRIKPDVVANGDSLYSTLGSGDNAYGAYSGTSMASPNACGSASLLIELYNRLFPGQAMRSSTLKGLLIHTADDRGTPGPDYQYGWGLVNAKAAADVIRISHDSPDTATLVENQLNSSLLTRTHPFAWDGISPLRATLCWTDPAGTAATTVDSRSPRLVNNLNLKIIAPDGTEYRPYVMPFVGTWTQSSMALPATTGINNTDNVEQIYIAAPPLPGTWQAVVSIPASPTATQHYSLLMSGTAPAAPLPPELVSITPDSAVSGLMTVTLSGANFRSGASVKFTLAGQNEVIAALTTTTATTLSGSLDVTGMVSGLWNVTVTNPDNQSSTLPASFAVTGTLWSQNFDTEAPPWTASANTGTSNWAPVTSQSHTSATAWFASGPATKNTDNLVSETISIPANASRLKLSFWHQYNLESRNDGGVLEFSINNGAWFRVTNTGSAESISSGGYNVTMRTPTGSSASRNEFAGNPAWSGTSGGSFSKVIVSLTDTAKYAGKSLRARWRLGTNGSIASPAGWFVDSVELTGTSGLLNQAPSIITPAEATPPLVTGMTTELSVTAADDGGAAGLTYTWSATGGSSELPVGFSENANNAAQLTTATFPSAGDYSLLVTIRDAAGATATGSVEVTVTQTPSQITVSPNSASLVYGATQLFTAAVQDQFGDPQLPLPDLIWSASGGGTIDASGTFTAQEPGGPFTIKATHGTVSGSSSVTINQAPASIILSNLAQTFDGSPRSVTATTLPAGLPVEISYNDTAAAPSEFGSYTVQATITDPNYTGNATATLTITGLPLANWEAQQFTSAQISSGAAADLADPDEDGLTNLSEYALGTNPLSHTPSLISHLDETGLWMSFDRPKGLPDVIYHAESSLDLETWTPLNLEIITNGPVQTVRVRSPEAATDRTGFIRVRFTRP